MSLLLELEFKVPDWVKMGVPGEKFLGKDKDGWEYTSHDLWRKKMIWKPEYKKIWRIEKKQEWVNEIIIDAVIVCLAVFQ